MKLADITLSFPHVAYDVTVSHYASRQATAIEWAILEAIQASSLDANYRDAPFAAVFEDILSIKDADRLIKPIIFDLVGTGMLLVRGLSDEISLSDMTMSQFELTEKGQKLRKDGILPGRTMEDVVQVHFNVFEDACKESKEKGLSPEATGIRVVEAESADDIVFPSAAVMGYLDSPRGRSGNQWLTKETKIQDLTSSNADLSWKNKGCRFEVGKNLSCSFKGIDNPPLAAKALEKLDLPFADDRADASVNDPDSELVWMDNPMKLAVRAKGLLEASKVAVIQADLFPDTISGVEKSALRGKVLYLSSAEAFSAKTIDGALVIESPEDLLPEGCAASFADESLHIGNFALHAGDVTRKATLLFSAPSSDGLLEKVCEDVARKNASTSLMSCIPLLIFDDNELFRELMLVALEGAQGFAQKSSAIDEANGVAEAILGSECISSEVAQEALAEEFNKAFAGCTFDDIAERIAAISKGSSSENGTQILNEAVKAGLSSLPEPSGIAQVWSLWPSLKELGIETASLDGEIVAPIYSAKCIGEILSVFDSDDFYAMEAFTPVERSILQLRRSSDSVSALLSNADLYKPLSEEDARLLCIANKGALGRVYSELKSWQENVDALNDVGLDPENAARQESPFLKVSTSMKSLGAGISPFYNESTLKYSSVYVVDTCALMNSPTLVSAFEDNKALLIVPTVVLDELDGLKSSDDGETALKAREAIRAIDNHRAFEWLELRENSHPELLSDDCDKERNDNKILSIAVRYIFKGAILITDDANLRNLAEANAIQAIGSGDFLTAKKDSRVKKKKAKQKGGKR